MDGEAAAVVSAAKPFSALGAEQVFQNAKLGESNSKLVISIYLLEG